MKRRYVDTGPDFETRLKVYDRDAHCCVRCGRPARGELGVDYSLQHRAKRSGGVDNRPCNLILLCGSGTTGCHGWVEDHPILAADEGGWAVSRYADPAMKPVLIRTPYGEWWKYLTDDFGYADAPPERAA
jgi:hypothetical protein